MRRAGVQFLSAVLASGLALSACSAQEADTDYHSIPPPKPGWFSGWFGGGGKSNAAPPTEDKKLNIDPATPRPALPDPIQGQRDREEKAMYRRLAVCDRLMDVAVRNDDRALQRKIEELTERVTTMYQHKMEHLGVVGSAPVAHAGVDGQAANLRGGN
jgi:hypothetical protein